MSERGRLTEFSATWLTPEQRRSLERMARVEGRTVSGMMRWLIDEETRRRSWVEQEETQEASDGSRD